jgi:hypothetical protein
VIIRRGGIPVAFFSMRLPTYLAVPLRPKKTQDTYAFSKCHLIDVVSISIFQWTIVALTPGTGLDGLVELVASSVIAGRLAWLPLLGRTAYKRRILLSLMWFLFFFFLSHLSYLLTIAPPTCSSLSRSSVSSGSSITSSSNNVSFYSCVSFSQGLKRWCSSS